MDITKLFESVLTDIKKSSTQSTRRKVKTIFLQLGAKTTSNQKAIDAFYEGLQLNNLQTDISIEFGMSNRQNINFWKVGAEVKTEAVEPLENDCLKVPDDFFRNLFEFDSDEEYERFVACLDSYSPMAIFLLPRENNFYSSVVERILSYEIVRKRQYSGEGAVIGNYRATDFNQSPPLMDLVDPNFSLNNWKNSDIHSFDESTLESVILGESGKELIESEKFESQFNQLSFYSNKYYAESGNQFFLLFKCPSFIKLEKQNKLINLDRLTDKVANKLPFTFSLRCKFGNDEELNENPEIKSLIVSHLKILFEVPFYEIAESDSLLDIYIELQKAQVQAENQVFASLNPDSLIPLRFGRESNEHIYLKLFAINSLISIPTNCKVTDIKCELRTTYNDELEDDEHTSIPDVQANFGSHTIVVEAETMRGKDYLKMTYEMLGKNNGWKGLKNLSELWLLFPGFELARNYYQIFKAINIIKDELQVVYKREIKVKGFAPDLINKKIIELSFAGIYKQNFEIKSSQKKKQSQPVIVEKPKLGLQNVKGLNDEKRFLLELKELSETNNSFGIGGILFYGLPGCGKTHLAKSFAQELGWNFFTFSPADIATGVIGLAQKNIKDIFKQAKSKSPSILFIDELDSIAFSRDNSDALTVHSDQKATINQLLIEMNNIDEQNVLIIGATNFLKSLDKAFTRTGRFDLKVPIYPPNQDERKEIIFFYKDKLNDELLQKSKKQFILSNENLDILAKLTNKFTSSDLEAIFNKPRIDALLNRTFDSFERLSQEIEDMINQNQISLNIEQVKNFIYECEQNRMLSSKLTELKEAWGISSTRIGFAR